jgi:GNAT superfamily N-acetyltransferase
VNEIVVRPAAAADVEAMSAVLMASITDLCTADHKGDAAFLARWLSNKTPAAVRAMFANPDITLYVAERADEIVAVGCLDASGEIRLNYVAPSHRFTGVSKTLLGALEAELKARGHATACLTSTVTARRFYRAAGWMDGDPAGSDENGYPMERRL